MHLRRKVCWCRTSISNIYIYIYDPTESCNRKDCCKYHKTLKSLLCSSRKKNSRFVCVVIFHTNYYSKSRSRPTTTPLLQFPSLMRVPIRHLLICLAVFDHPGLVVGSPTDVTGKIEDAEILFSKEGPTPVVLQHFDHVINDVRSYLLSEAVDSGHNELNKSLTQLLFKRALIEISLKKEALAIVDLQDVLKLDPLMKPAENKLVEILVARGILIIWSNT